MAQQPNNQSSKKTAIRGWVEVLYRRHPAARIDSAKELDLSDYDLVGSTMPINEFETPVDVLEMLNYGQGHAEFKNAFAPRNIAVHDVVNLVRIFPEPQVTVSMLVVKMGEHAHLKYAGCHVDMSKDGELALLQLEDSLGSVVLGNN